VTEPAVNIRAGVSPRPEVGNQDEALIRSLVEHWALAVRNADMEGVLAEHAPDIVMFDVPAPVQIKGIEAYRKSWEVFFANQGKGGAFNLTELEIAAGHDVAFCHAVVTCGGADPADQFPVRLTIGLRKVDNTWIVTHEHHSVTAPGSLAGDVTGATVVMS
jgi:uncharacterized protein (TIGR02246 family)